MGNSENFGLDFPGFENCYLKFAQNNENLTFWVPENLGSGNPELPDFSQQAVSTAKRISDIVAFCMNQLEILKTDAKPKFPINKPKLYCIKLA